MLSTPRRLWQILKSQPQATQAVQQVPAEPAAPATPSDLQGLFVIGAARSGTTVLQNALNSSAQIFLFGEPALQDDPGSADFAARYNAMHRAWGNQENKSSFCPPVLPGDGSWSDYLAHLATLYRYVGSKIVVTPETAEQTCHRLFEFHCRHFYRSHYVFTFRNPIDVLISTRGLAELHGNEAASHAQVLKSFLQVVALYIRFLRNLPSVMAVFHEGIDAAVFQRAGQWLGLDLSEAAKYYDGQRVRHHTLQNVPAHAHDLTLEVMEIYATLRELVDGGIDLPQLEQNNNHLNPAHFTPLGNLSRRIEQLLASP